MGIKFKLVLNYQNFILHIVTYLFSFVLNRFVKICSFLYNHVQSHIINC